MKRLIIEPNGFPCKFEEYKSGFFLCGEELCLKSEYGQDAYCSSGEYFWGGTADIYSREQLVIQPVVAKWMEEE